MVSKINAKPQLNLRRSRVSLQKVAPSSNISIEKRVATLEMNVALLAKSINKEADLEKKQQRENERNLKKQEENKLRSGEEKQLEKKLSKSILAPAEKMGSKAGGILGKLKSFFMLLLGGWLTNQGLDAFIALANGDNDKLKQIGIEVGKTLAIVGGIFLALNVGILGVVGIIGKIALAVTLAPFKFAFRKLGELLTRKPPVPKPPNTNTGGGKPQAPSAGPGGPGGPGGGVNQVGTGGRAGSRLPGSSNPSGNSTFATEQARNNLTRNNMLKNQGAKGPFDAIRRFVVGKLEQHRHVGKGKHIVKVLDGAMRMFRFVSGLPGFKQLFGVMKGVINAVTKPRSFIGELLKKIGGAGAGAGRTLLRLLRPILFAKEISNRASAGMSPAQAILGSLFPLAGSIAGGALGGTIGAAGGPLAFFGALGGSFLGDILGRQIMGVLDNFWTPNRESWDGFGPIKALNDAVYDLQGGEGNLAKTLQFLFPYQGTEKHNKSNAEISSTPESTSTPGEMPASPSSANVSSSASSMPSAPGALSGGGNTTVIYKKIGSSGGQQVQGQPLKTGSATDVPLVASANPSNFYTMYSQTLYNVVI